LADALLAEFAKNFGQAAAAVAVATAPKADPAQATVSEPAAVPAAAAVPDAAARLDAVAAPSSPPPVMPAPAARAPAAELNVLSLLWSMVRQWWRNLIGGKR
jgi:hypothetical protein